jgi:hypothetical protein
MNEKRVTIIICLATILLAACAPSPQAIETAMAKTQAAWTPTPTFTSTPTPRPTFTPTLTSTSTPMPTRVPVVLYSDDFSNRLSGWLVSNYNNNGGKYQYSGGQYVISRPKGNWINWACANRSFTDAVITIDTILVSGSGNQIGPAILWRYVDTNNFYYFELTGDGEYVLDKEVKGVWQNLRKWTFSSAINKAQQINNITISFGGGTSAIYINGTYVTNLQDTEFTTGDICLGAASSDTSAVEVSFDNLVIYTIDSWTAPKQ